MSMPVLASLPTRLEITAQLDESPRYRGTVHEDATAKSLGYRAALIPGAFVYGHVTRLAVQGWGMKWIERGRISARFRRPVYNGDQLTVSRGELQQMSDGVTAAISVSNGEGEEVLTGSIGLADNPLPPPLPLPVALQADPRPEIGSGEMTVGTRVGTRNIVLAPEDVAASLATFAETDPTYRERGVVHSGCLLRVSMSDTLGSFSFPMAVIFVAADVQNFAPAQPGMRLATSGRVTDVYERKGKHYFESEEYLVADGQTVIARHTRLNLYAMEKGAR